MKFNFGKLSIYTVKDFGKTSLNTGQYILYEYLKSDTVYLNYDSQSKATIEATISKKINAKISNGLNGSKKIAFSGRDLIFAYRIFSFGKTSKKEKTVKIKDTKDGGGYRKINVLDYEIRFNDEALQRCLDQGGHKIPMDLNEFHACEKSTPIEIYIRNYNNKTISGKPMSKNMETLANTSTEIYFTYKKDGKVVTDDITIDYAYREGKNIFYLYMNDSLSKVTMRRIETKMTMLNNPSAPGW